MEDFGPDLITLLDEDGKEHSFEYLDTLEHGDYEYVALTPVLEDPADAVADDGELVVLRIEEENGEEILVAIEDDEEFDTVSSLFIERLSDLYEFEDEDEEEQAED